MTLDQLMAFTVSPDHERQEQVWEAIQRSYSKEPYQIRRMLTEDAVRACDKRARYVGEDYVAAGGAVMRDLFQSDDGGWLQDAKLLDRLVSEKLERDAEAIRAEGWKWVEVATDFPYGHTYGLRHLQGERQPLSEEEAATREALRLEADELEATYADADEIPERVDARLSEIETALEAFEQRPVLYAPEDVARAGAFVSIDGSGKLRIERGYVRPEDEPPLAEPEIVVDEGEDGVSATSAPISAARAVERNRRWRRPLRTRGGRRRRPSPSARQAPHRAHRLSDAGAARGDRPASGRRLPRGAACPLPEALLSLRLRLLPRDRAEDRQLSEASPLALATPCLRQASMRAIANGPISFRKSPTISGTRSRRSTPSSSKALFAHCVSLTVNAVNETYNRRPRAIAHADRLAEALSLDVAATGWAPSVDNFLGRVTKARILDAVREARGEDQARRIEHLKKGEMAAQAEHLLAGSGWLPEPLRTPRRAPQGSQTVTTSAPDEAPVEETAAIESETAIDEIVAEDEAEDASADHPDIAAE